MQKLKPGVRVFLLSTNERGTIVKLSAVAYSAFVQLDHGGVCEVPFGDLMVVKDAEH